MNIKKRLRKIKKDIQLSRKNKRECIQDTVFKTGWSEREAKKRIKKTMKSIGVSYEDYYINNLCRVEDADQQTYWDNILLRRTNQEEIRKKNKSKKEETSPAEKPYGTKISKISDAGVEFYWKKPERATGYEVFRSYEEDGHYEKIATIPRRRIGNYTDSEFDYNKKKIFYKVRSVYVDNDGIEHFSELTKPAAANYLENLVLDLETVILYSGMKKKISALYGWGELNNGIWKSDNKDVATVDNTGEIVAVGKGKCNITCRNELTGETVTAFVEVDREPTTPLFSGQQRFVFDDKKGIWKNPKAKNTGVAVIMMVGDMMCSSTQMKKQYSRPQGWNFNDSFKYVRPVMKKSDFAVGNVETLLASSWPYMIDEAWIDNTNNCNAPSRYLDAVRYAGFDGLAMANNHNCDGGIQALIDTIEEVDKYKFARTGAFISEKEPRYFIADVNGVKVGYVSYMTEGTTFNGKDKNWTPEEKNRHLNIFTFEKAKEDIRKCKEAGAEYVIAYMHWGVKNYRNITRDQELRAKEIADAGVDFIVGANPHVCQVYDEIKTDDGRTVPCYYSIGNFQAVMRQVEGNRDSLIIRIELKRSRDGNVKLTKNEYIPCYCFNNCEGACWATVPLVEGYNTSKRRNRQSLLRTKEALGSKASPVKWECNEYEKPTRTEIRRIMALTGWRAYEAYRNMTDMRETGIIDFYNDIDTNKVKEYKTMLSRSMLKNEQKDINKNIISESEFYGWFHTENQKRAIDEIKQGKITYKILADYMEIKLPENLMLSDKNIANLLRTRGNRTNKGDVLIMYTDKGVTSADIKRRSPELIICLPKYEEIIKDSGIPYVLRSYLGSYIFDISQLWRETINPITIVISGSIGKTTTTEMLGEVVGDAMPMYKIKGNQNTEKQIPGLIFNLNKKHKAFVQEASGSFVRQLEINSRVLKPDLFALTNIGHSHIGNFGGSRELLLYEKLSLDRHANDGAVGLINMDDDLLSKSTYNHKVLWYSLHNKEADFYAEEIVEKDGEIEFILVEKTGEKTPVHINMSGTHNVYNAIVAFGLAVQLNIPRENISNSLGKYGASGVRQHYTRYGGRRLYLDCYSVTEESMKSTLIATGKISVPEGGRRVFIMGDIVRMGDDAEKIHRRMGKMVADVGIADEIYMYGPLMKYTYDEAVSRGVKCRHTENLKEMESWIREETDENDLVTFKSNHKMRFEWIIDNICGTDFFFEDEETALEPVKTIDGFTYKLVKDYGAGILKCDKNKTHVVLPEDIEGFSLRVSGRSVFKNSETLKTIVLPDGLSCISESCFKNCVNLEEVTCGKSLQFIGEEAFCGCEKLEVLNFSNTGLQTIEKKAFNGCTGLKKVIFPNTLKWMSPTAFDKETETVIVCKKDSYAMELASELGINVEEN